MTETTKPKTNLCPRCQGSGIKDGMRCTPCNGTGEAPKTPAPEK